MKVRELNAFVTETPDVGREQVLSQKESYSRTSMFVIHVCLLRKLLIFVLKKV